MRLKRRVVLLAAGLPLIFAGLVGCGGGGSSKSPAPSADRPVTTRSAYGPLEFTLTAPKTVYKRGETALLVFTVKNTSSDEVQFQVNGSFFGTTVTKDDKVIYGPGATTAQIYTKTIAPGQTESYPTTWNLKDFAGASIAQGKYFLLTRLATPAITIGAGDPLLFSPDERNTLLGPPPVEVTVK